MEIGATILAPIFLFKLDRQGLFQRESIFV